MKIIKSVTTADATPTDMVTINATADDAGVIVASVVGTSTGNGAVTGVKAVRYKKVAGTLTLGAATSVLAVEVDTALGASTFAFAVVGNNIVLRVTGNAATSIKWNADITHTSGN